MAIDTQGKKDVIKAKLRLGIKPKDIATQLGITVSKVYDVNNQLRKDMELEPVQELVDIPKDVIQHVVEEAKKVLPLSTPSQESPMNVALDALVTGIDGLKLLDNKFQVTIGKVLTRFDSLIDDETTPLKDLKLMIDTAANAHEKIFSSGTNIHIGDNNSHSSQKLTVFQNKKGV